MCNGDGYITKTFCDKYNVLYRVEVARCVLIPVALGMVLANSKKNYGTDEWKNDYNLYMLNIYVNDCNFYDKYKKENEEWYITRNEFYDLERYPL